MFGRMRRILGLGVDPEVGLDRTVEGPIFGSYGCLEPAQVDISVLCHMMFFSLFKLYSPRSLRFLIMYTFGCHLGSGSCQKAHGETCEEAFFRCKVPY